MTKIVRHFPNNTDNLHCLQSCAKGVLSHFFPTNSFTDEEIERKTLFNNGWTWLPPLTNWFNELGLTCKLYATFDYERLTVEGINYLREVKTGGSFKLEESNGTYSNISEIQLSCKNMISDRLWINRQLSITELETYLLNENTYAIGKTIYEELAGQPINLSKFHGHFLVFIKEYDHLRWRVNDPGLPDQENRKVLKKNINGMSIFYDILIITT